MGGAIYFNGTGEVSNCIFTNNEAVAEYDGLDLVLWPECAVPASMGYQPFMAMLIKLQQKTKIPLLMGAIQNRLPPGENAPELVRTFNSVLLLDEKAHHYLRASGVDYYHGTGHGIGMMLGVHEYPPAVYSKDEKGLVFRCTKYDKEKR